MTVKTSTRRRLTILGLLGPFTLVFACTIVLPIVVAVVRSLHGVTHEGPLGRGTRIESFVGPANYARALTDTGFVSSIGRVILFGVVQVPVMIVLATVLALLGLTPDSGH